MNPGGGRLGARAGRSPQIESVLRAEEHPGVLGDQHFAFLASVTALYAGWIGDAGAAGLTPIEFDKLVNLGARMARTAHRSLDGVFPDVPYEELPGVHGPGQVLMRHREEEERRYFLRVLADLQEILPEADLPLVLIPPHGSPIDPNDPDLRIELALPNEGLAGALERLGSSQSDLFAPVAACLEGMPGANVRALGTHCDATAALSAVNFHVKALRVRWKRWFAQARSPEGPDETDVEAMGTSKRELRRKLKENEPRYEEARDGVLEALPADCMARMCFERIHRPAGDIWGDQRIRALRTNEDVRYALVSYAEISTEASGRIGSNREKALQRDLEEAHSLLPLEDPLPSELSGLASTGSINGAFLDRLEALADKHFFGRGGL